MKIVSIKATPVTIPFRFSAAMSCGAAGATTRTIVELATDCGLVGLGEASYAFPAQIIEHEFAPRIVGLDPREHHHVRRHCLPDTVDFGTPMLKARLAAWGGIEIAIWDLIGKQMELPLFRVFGGAVRQSAPFVAYAYHDARIGASEAAARMARSALEQITTTGASIFEFKLGYHSVDVDIETVRAVHEAVGKVARLAVDSNLNYTIDDARRLFRAVGPLIENAEEPTTHFVDMQRLYSEFGVPVSTHQADLSALAAYPGISGVVPTLDVMGGFTALFELIPAARQSGRRVWLRSQAEAGIGWAAMVHAGMAMRGLNRPAQCLIDLIENDLIVGETWLVRNGGVCAPDRPGLGVELDREAFAHYHEQFKRLGEASSFPPDLSQAQASPKGRRTAAWTDRS